MRSRAFAISSLALVSATAAFAAPPSPEAWQAYRSGQAALAQEDFPMAERQFRIALQQDRLLSLAHYGLGTVMAATRRYQEALDEFTQAIAVHREWLAQKPTDAAKLDMLRDEEIEQLREYIKAIEQGKVKFVGQHKVLQLESRIQQIEREKGQEKTAVRGTVPAEFFVALGSAHYRLGHVDEARAAYEEAIKMDPERGDAHNNLAALAVARGDQEGAREHVRRAEAEGFRVHPDLKRDAGLDANEAAFGIEHQPLRCAVADRAPVIEARAVGKTTPATMRVRFKSPDSPYWYLVRMEAQGDRFVTRLPKPKPGLTAFTYRIDATDEMAASARTQPVTVNVVSAAECPGDAGPAVRAALLVEVPESAPKKPPVPEGFNPEGVKGVGGTQVGWLPMPAKIGAALGVAVTTAVTVAGSGGIPDANDANVVDVVPRPQIDLVSMVPAPGATLVSPSQRIEATFRITLSRPANRVFLGVDLVTATGLGCIQLAQTGGPVIAGSPFEITASGPADASRFCPGSFEVRGLSVNVQPDGDTTLATRQHFELFYNVVRASGS